MKAPPRQARGEASRRPEGSFVAVVPAGTAGLRAVVRELPAYDAQACNGCKIIPTCRGGSSRLPFMVWEALPQAHTCRKTGQGLTACVVKPWEDVHVEPIPEPKLYIIDANILLNAFNQHPEWGEACWWVLEEANVRIATTRQVLEEAWDTKGHELPTRLEVLDIGPIDPRLRELRPPEGRKGPSDNDLSLMQAVLENKEIEGIVTFDPDFKAIAAGSMLSLWTGRRVWIMDAPELRDGPRDR